MERVRICLCQRSLVPFCGTERDRVHPRRSIRKAQILVTPPDLLVCHESWLRVRGQRCVALVRNCVIRFGPTSSGIFVVLQDLGVGDVFHLLRAALWHGVHLQNRVHAYDRERDRV